MKVTILGSGTSQGIPLIGCKCPTCTSSDQRDKRLRSSIFVETEQVKIQVDVGPDFRQQFLKNNIESLDHVLITHEHNDHIIGIDDLRAINFIQKKAIPIYAEAHVLESIKKRFHYAFSNNKYYGVPELTLHPINLDPLYFSDIKVIPIRVQHGKLDILGFRFNDFAYITDASHITNEEIEKIKNVDILVVNALRREKHYSHFNLKEACTFIEKVSPRQAYLTHLSHAMGPVSSIERELPKNVKVLNDNLVINI